MGEWRWPRFPVRPLPESGPDIKTAFRIRREAQCSSDIARPGPGAADHGGRNGSRLVLLRAVERRQFVEQKGGARAQCQRLMSHVAGQAAAECPGHAEGRGNDKGTRAHECEDFQDIEGRQMADSGTPSGGHGMAQEGHGPALPPPAGLFAVDLLDDSVSSQPDGTGSTCHKCRSLGPGHGAISHMRACRG